MSFRNMDDEMHIEDESMVINEADIFNLALLTVNVMYVALMTPGLVLHSRRQRRISRRAGFRRVPYPSGSDAIRNATIIATAAGPETSWWVKPRSTVWFDRFVMELFDDARWKENFRMTKASFYWICNLLGPTIKKQDTRYRRSVPVLVRVGAAFYKFFKGCDFMEASEKFGIGVSTCSMVLREVCRAINVHLKHKIRWPNSDEIAGIEASFKDVSGLPNCYGAIDCTHVEIIRPHGVHGADYYDRTQRHSIVLQAVCDTSRKFRDVFVGYPGSTHDARVLRNSGLATRAHEGQILREPTLIINGNYPLRPYIVGDKGYVSSPWLISPYIGDVANLPSIERLFNERHVQARLFIEQSFGIMKKVFKCLKTRLEMDVNFIPELIFSCCVLHNLLVESRDIDVEKELLELEDEEEEEDNQESTSTDDGASIRANLAQYLVFNS